MSGLLCTQTSPLNRVRPVTLLCWHPQATVKSTLLGTATGPRALLHRDPPRRTSSKEGAPPHQHTWRNTPVQLTKNASKKVRMARAVSGRYKRAKPCFPKCVNAGTRVLIPSMQEMPVISDSDSRMRAGEWSDICIFNFNSTNVLVEPEGSGLGGLVCYTKLLVAGVLYSFLPCTALSIDSYLYTFWILKLTQG